MAVGVQGNERASLYHFTLVSRDDTLPGVGIYVDPAQAWDFLPPMRFQDRGTPTHTPNDGQLDLGPNADFVVLDAHNRTLAECSGVRRPNRFQPADLASALPRKNGAAWPPTPEQPLPRYVIIITCPPRHQANSPARTPGPLSLRHRRLALLGTAPRPDRRRHRQRRDCDPSGARVPGTTVTLTRPETGAQRNATSDAQEPSPSPPSRPASIVWRPSAVALPATHGCWSWRWIASRIFASSLPGSGRRRDRRRGWNRAAGAPESPAMAPSLTSGRFSASLLTGAISTSSACCCPVSRRRRKARPDRSAAPSPSA